MKELNGNQSEQVKHAFTLRLQMELILILIVRLVDGRKARFSNWRLTLFTAVGTAFATTNGMKITVR